MRSFIRITSCFAILQTVTAVNCPTLSSSYPAPVTLEGWSNKLIAQDIPGARGILFDKKNNLLVIEQGRGIVHLEFDDGDGSCLELKKKTTLISSSEVILEFRMTPSGSLELSWYLASSWTMELHFLKTEKHCTHRILVTFTLGLIMKEALLSANQAASLSAEWIVMDIPLAHFWCHQKNPVP